MGVGKQCPPKGITSETLDPYTVSDFMNGTEWSNLQGGQPGRLKAQRHQVGSSTSMMEAESWRTDELMEVEAPSNGAASQSMRQNRARVALDRSPS